MKICYSEATVIFLSCLIISASCIFWCRESSKMQILPIFTNGSIPSLCFFAPIDPFESARIIGLLLLICAILQSCSLSKIGSSIVQTISIYMVYVHIRTGFENYTMHSYFLIGSHYVKSFRRIIPLCIPIPARKPFKILCIDNSVLVSRKWNQAIRWIKWLGNGMPFTRRFGMNPPYKDLCYPVILSQEVSFACDTWSTWDGPNTTGSQHS